MDKTSRTNINRSSNISNERFQSKINPGIGYANQSNTNDISSYRRKSSTSPDIINSNSNSSSSSSYNLKSYSSSSNFNQNSSYPRSKQSMINIYGSWFEELRSTHSPMALTAVFKSQSFKPQKYRWIDEYQHKVIWKINKQISRRASELIVHSDICYYEHSEVSSAKSLKDYRYPHHVHGIVFIRNEHFHKVWDIDTDTIRPSLQRDFDSIKTVSSVLMEPIPEGTVYRWLSYITKGKPFNG